MCKIRQERMTMLIEALKDYNEGEDKSSKIRDLTVQKGKAISLCLFRPHDDAIAVAHTKVNPNTEFPKHYHNEKEFITVFRGEIKVFFLDENQEIKSEITLMEGDNLVIPEGIEHAHFATSDGGCELIVMTIPASKGFPK